MARPRRVRPKNERPKKTRREQNEQVPWCCPGPQKNTCAPPPAPLRQSSAPAAEEARGSPQKKNAFATLLMMGDGYLPGACLLGVQLRALAPEIARVCMVTGDVTEAARRTLLQVYTHLAEVPYIKTDEQHLGPKGNPEQGERYRSSFTKLNVLGLTQFDKVAFMDADSLPLRSMREIFHTPVPAAVFVGCFHPEKGAVQLFHYLKSICRGLAHGDPVTWERQTAERERCKESKYVYLGFESAVFVCRPSLAELRRLVDLMREIEGDPAKTRGFLLKGDTTLLSYAWASYMHLLDPRYLVRSPKPTQVRDAFLLDMYSRGRKPWDAATAVETPQAKLNPPATDTQVWWTSFEAAAAALPALFASHPALADTLAGIRWRRARLSAQLAKPAGEPEPRKSTSRKSAPAMQRAGRSVRIGATAGKRYVTAAKDLKSSV